MNVGRKRIRSQRSDARSVSRARKASKKALPVFTSRVARPLKDNVSFNFRYATTVSLDPGLGGAAIHVFSGNGLYDVDITGVGHQPTGFDQLMIMFDHYVVLKSSIKVIFQNTADTQRNIVGVCARDSATTTTDWREYVEQGTSTWDYLGVEGGSPKSTQIQTFNTGPFLGRKSPLSDPDLKGSVTSNPTEQFYWHVWASGDGADTSAVFGVVVIDFFGMMIEPKSAGLS